MLVWYFIPWLFLKNYLPWCKYYLELSLLPQLRDDLPKYGNPKLISVSFSSCNYIVSHSVRFLGSDSNIIEVIILIIRWEIQSLSHGKSAFCLSSLSFFFSVPTLFHIRMRNICISECIPTMQISNDGVSCPSLHSC